MTDPLDDALLARIEAHAVDIARGAGAVLTGYFGKPLDVEYKDEKEGNPVTNADRESQEYLRRAIADEFPDHGIVGEEDRQEEDSPARDFVWVLDPLDGTKNFLAGLPVYACSVGVIHRGVPVAGAVFVPWPSDSGGAVLHARKGGGAFVEREPISVLSFDEPRGSSLAAFPGSFGVIYGFRKAMRARVGEVRVTGSIAYELAMTANGVLHYTVTTAPHLWDVAAGVVLVKEAGGLVMRGQRASGLKALLTDTRWEPVESLVPSWHGGGTSMKQLRRRLGPMVFGNSGVVRYVTSNMRARMLLKYRLARLLGRRTRKRGK